jgi:hypothetical protein
MDYDEFLTIVQQRLGIDREQAEQATRATVETLAQRIAAGSMPPARPSASTSTMSSRSATRRRNGHGCRAAKGLRAAAAERTPYRVPLGRRLRATGRRQLHQLEAQSLLPDGDNQRRALGEQRARLAHRLLGGGGPVVPDDH